MAESSGAMALPEAGPPQMELSVNLPQYTLTDESYEHLNKFWEELPQRYALKANQNARSMVFSFGTPRIPEFKYFSYNQKTLPTFKRRKDFLDALESNQVVIVAGETGCGKSTQLPQYIINDSARKRQPALILCTQPRRLSTKAVAERVAFERNTELGNAVGYRMSNDSCTSKNSNIIFMTK